MVTTGASKSRGIITLAFGKDRYINMAKALGRSLVLYDPTLPRAVVTDSKDPELKSLFPHFIPYRPEYGSNLRQKMHFDLYSPFEETLFIDSDCLVLRNLDRYWDAFAGLPFGVNGHSILGAGSEDEYMDVAFILDHFSLTELPKFNGGAYYFTNSPQANAFFETARTVMANWKELRLKDFRGDGPNDETVYSIAMSIHKLTVTDTGEGGMWTPINSVGPIKLDVLKGDCRFRKAGRDLKPDIVHFATVWAETYPYRRDCLRLEKFARNSYADPAKADLTFSEAIQLRSSVIQERVPRFFRGVMRRVRALRKKFSNKPLAIPAASSVSASTKNG
jgi:hypothetical protein